MHQAGQREGERVVGHECRLQREGEHVEPGRGHAIGQAEAGDAAVVGEPRDVHAIAQDAGRTRHRGSTRFHAAERMPRFERLGSFNVAKAAAELTREGRLVSVAGGGDTVAALNKAGVAGDFTFISTAGGAFLEWMEGKTLPGVAALQKR